MFTNDQVTRMQTALQSSPYRKLLGTTTICTHNSTGLSNLIRQNNMVIYPNPSSGMVHFIATMAEAVDLDIVVTNVTGQVILKTSKKNVLNTEISIDLSDQEKGIYFITIITPNLERVTKKIGIE